MSSTLELVSNFLIKGFGFDDLYSVCVMMNKLTRRLSRIPEEAKREFESCFVKNSALILEEDNRKLPQLDANTANYIRAGLNVCQLLLYTYFYLLT